jgi:hypothetical protein
MKKLIFILFSLNTFAKLNYNLRGEYQLESVQIKNNQIIISFNGIKNVIVCGAIDEKQNPNLKLLNEALSLKKKIEITANDGDECVSDLHPAISEKELFEKVNTTLKNLNPKNPIDLNEFDPKKINLRRDSRLLSTLRSILYIPYGKAAVRDLNIYWNRDVGKEQRYGVSGVFVILNEENESSHKEFTQGTDDWEKLPIVPSKMNDEILKLAKSVDLKNKLGMFKNLGEKAYLMILEKPKYYLVKKVVLGQCTQEREITILKIEKETKKALLPILNEYISSDECPD